MKEIWDAYDKYGNIIKNKSIIRGNKIEDGMYHIVACIIVKHIDGSYLLTQRHPNKSYPLKWEISVGGSVKKGESPIDGAKRELFEEAGIKVDDLKLLDSYPYDKKHSLYFIYEVIVDINKDSIILQEKETIDYKWLKRSEIDLNELAVYRPLIYMI